MAVSSPHSCNVSPFDKTGKKEEEYVKLQGKFLFYLFGAQNFFTLITGRTPLLCQKDIQSGKQVSKEERMKSILLFILEKGVLVIHKRLSGQNIIQLSLTLPVNPPEKNRVLPF